jgi:hypothetical protein
MSGTIGDGSQQDDPGDAALLDLVSFHSFILFSGPKLSSSGFMKGLRSRLVERRAEVS